MANRLKCETIRAIAVLYTEQGYHPTLRELAAKLGISLSAVHHRVKAMNQEGIVSGPSSHKERTLRNNPKGIEFYEREC